MKLFKPFIFVFACASVSAFYTSAINAETLAITNATIHTATDQGVLTNATVIIESGKIIAVNADKAAVDKADAVFDAKGQILTPGLIGSMNQLGLVEVNAVSGTRDASDKKADITFDASIGFNPRSTVIPYTRKGGITSNIVAPRGGESIFKGKTFAVDLSGSFDSIVASNNAILVDLGAKRKGSRAYDMQQLINKLEDAQKKLDKAKKKLAKEKADKKESKEDGNKKDSKKEDEEPVDFKRDELIINAVLAGTQPLVVYADRATDILALIKLKQRFGLNLIIRGAADAVLVTDQLVKAEIPVLINSMRNLPGSFDSLHTALNSAAILTSAGVKVGLSISYPHAINDPHFLYQLRFDAGNAIANGLSKDQGLAVVTANIADMFGLNSGAIEVGKNADLVLWSADPFELSSRVVKMWIGGDEFSTQSRQDALRDRYTTKSDMPRAYTK